MQGGDDCTRGAMSVQSMDESQYSHVLPSLHKEAAGELDRLFLAGLNRAPAKTGIRKRI